jgi:YVTN family beta-propeller protein
VPQNPGTAQQIDVSGDTVIGQTPTSLNPPNIGINPTHAAILSNNSRVFVASAGSVFPGDADIVSSFTPAFSSGLGTVVRFSLPAGSLPVFVNSTQSNAVYVANYGTNSVAVINPSLNVVSNIVTVGRNPVALAETPNPTNNLAKLYVVNQGDSTVTVLNTVDMTTATVIGLPALTTPVWAVARLDGQRVYVVTQADGKLYTIRTDSDSLDGTPQSVGGSGANFVLYDKNRNRLYVTNPTAGAVFVFDATTDQPTPLGNPAGISIPAPAVSAVGPVIPVSVTALPDGSRFYVASYVTATGACPDPNVVTAQCVIPQVTVFDAASLTVKTTVFPLLPVATTPVSGVQPFAVAPVASCAPVTPYTPSSIRFRLSMASAADSSRTYVGMCDAGSIASIRTTTSTIASGGSNQPDTLVTDLNAPVSAGPPQSNGEPLPQSPIFLLTGQ